MTSVRITYLRYWRLISLVSQEKVVLYRLATITPLIDYQLSKGKLTALASLKHFELVPFIGGEEWRSVGRMCVCICRGIGS